MPFGAIGRFFSSLRPCSHDRAPILFGSEHKDDCQILAYNCTSYIDFTDGKCASCGSDNSGCALLGIKYIGQEAGFPPRQNCEKSAKFFVKAATSPFCREFAFFSCAWCNFYVISFVFLQFSSSLSGGGKNGINGPVGWNHIGQHS